MNEDREIIPAIFTIPEDEVYFIVPGRPQMKMRPRMRRFKNFVTTYTPEKTKNYEKFVRECWKKQSGTSFERGTPLELKVRAHFPINKSTPKYKRKDMQGAPCMLKGDLDNISKILQDAGNGVIFYDDAEIVKQSAMKDYTEGEGFVEVEMRRCTDLNI